MNIIEVQTKDGWKLEGAYWPSEASSEVGVVLVNGWSDWYVPSHTERSFLGKFLRTIGNIFPEKGIHAISVMQRGFHSPEFFNDCVFDIQACIDFLKENGCKKIVIMGHSLGGAKTAYFAGTQNVPELKAIVLKSAIPAIHDGYTRADLLKTSREMIAKGEGELFFSKKEGKETIVNYNPNMFVKNYEEGYQKNTLDIAAEITIPILSIAAEHEWDWFHTVTLGIKEAAQKSPRVDTQIVKGAPDHGYTGHETEVAEYILQWIREIVG